MGILKCATAVLDQWFSNLNVHQNHPTGLLKKKTKNRMLFTRVSDSVALGWGPSGGAAAAV